jgi:hypothetical protein
MEKKRADYRYKTRTRRIDKFHHRIEVDSDLTPQQANWILADTLTLSILSTRDFSMQPPHSPHVEGEIACSFFIATTLHCRLAD